MHFLFAVTSPILKLYLSLQPCLDFSTSSCTLIFKETFGSSELNFSPRFGSLETPMRAWSKGFAVCGFFGSSRSSPTWGARRTPSGVLCRPWQRACPPFYAWSPPPLICITTLAVFFCNLAIFEPRFFLESENM